MNYLKTYDKLFGSLEYNKHTNREPRFLFAVSNIKKSGAKSAIDIGSGNGNLLKIIHKTDPSISLFSADLRNYHGLDYVSHIDADITRHRAIKKPEVEFDVLTCLDCLEHIEKKHIDDALNMLSMLSSLFLFSIANHPDKINGVELHLIQKDSMWWNNKLSKYFHITYFESLYDDRLYLYKCRRKKK